MHEVADEVNDMAETLRPDPGPGRLERYLIRPFKALVIASPVAAAVAAVVATATRTYDVPYLAQGGVAYAGVVVAGSALSYIFYRLLRDEDDDSYIAGPGSRLPI